MFMVVHRRRQGTEVIGTSLPWMHSPRTKRAKNIASTPINGNDTILFFWAHFTSIMLTKSIYSKKSI